jgi:hypothetical protein
MKTNMKTILTTLSMLFCVIVMSQNEVDALRYSRLIHGGTARYMAMGGAFSTLGADFSVLSSNPAGIGVYKKSEFMFTPAFSFNMSEAKYLGSTGEDKRYNFNFSNFGMVFAGSLGNSENTAPEWKGIQFGFGINRLQSFNNKIFIHGLNETGTILDVYHTYAQGTPNNQLNPFDTQLAYDAYLIDTAGTITNYTQAHYGGATQKKSIKTSGGINEMVMTFGGNYNDRFYLGATLGIPFVRYEELSSYQEVDDRDTIPGFKSLKINDELTTYGTGVNLKLGLIYRITDWVRISGAFHTPTFYALTDQWQRSMSSSIDGIGNFSYKSPRGKYDYNLITPMRIIGGVAFVIAQHGSISAEYEMVDYSEAQLGEKNLNGSFIDQNETINSIYTVANNIRIGAEYVIAPFSLRAGYALYGNPFKNNLNDETEQIISGGLGIREKNYFLDFAYVLSSMKSDYYLYPKVAEAAKTSTSRHMFVCTVGWKF